MFLFNSKKEEKFWKYFQENEEIIYNFEKDQENIFNELASQLHKMDENLTFEFGPIKNDKRDFVISADGIKSTFSSVEKLCEKVPELNFFNVIKFRPRRKELYDISFADKTIKSDEIRYVLFKDENPRKIGILLLFKNYKEEVKDLFVQAGFLFLDGILGEFDVETKLGVIDFTSYDSEHYLNSKPLSSLVEDFDNYFKNV